MPEIGAPHKLTHQDGGNDEVSVIGLSGLLADDQHVLDAEVLAVASAKVHGSLHFPDAADPINLPKFSAHKNGTNQTGIPLAVYTKVTFQTEIYDVGSKYDAPNSKWVPGVVGVAHISANIVFLSMEDQKQIVTWVYKNGSPLKRAWFSSSGTDVHGAMLGCDVPITGVNDYIEIFAYHEATADKIISGLENATWFMGHMLP